jgi:hypothetical protein
MMLRSKNPQLGRTVVTRQFGRFQQEVQSRKEAASAVKYPFMHTWVVEMTCAGGWTGAYQGTLRDSRSVLGIESALSAA